MIQNENAAEVPDPSIPLEQRRSERVRLPLELRWESLSGRHAARLYDLSSTGCYIEAPGQVQTGELVRFEVQSPTGRWLRLKGEVVHAQTHMGFALRFLDLSESQTCVIDELVEYARAVSVSTLPAPGHVVPHALVALDDGQPPCAVEMVGAPEPLLEVRAMSGVALLAAEILDERELAVGGVALVGPLAEAIDEVLSL